MRRWLRKTMVIRNNNSNNGDYDKRRKKYAIFGKFANRELEAQFEIKTTTDMDKETGKRKR